MLEKTFHYSNEGKTLESKKEKYIHSFIVFSH